MMVILNADDGKIITSLPLAGGSDGAVFNPATMEAFSSHGNGTMTIVKENSPTSFAVEQDLQTMAGAKTLTLDTKTNHILTMAAEYGPPPPAPARPGRRRHRAAAAVAHVAPCCPIRFRFLWWASSRHLYREFSGSRLTMKVRECEFW